MMKATAARLPALQHQQSNLKIERISSNWLEDMVRLREAHGGGHLLPDNGAGLKDQFNMGAYAFGALDGPRLAGMTILTVENDIPPDLSSHAAASPVPLRLAKIGGVVRDPAYAGQGVGNLLIERCEDVAELGRRNAVFARVLTTCAPSLNLFLRNQFAIVATGPSPDRLKFGDLRPVHTVLKMIPTPHG